MKRDTIEIMPATIFLSAKYVEELLYRKEQEVITGTIAPTAFQAFMWITIRVTEKQTAEELWSQSQCGLEKTVNGQSYIAAAFAGN